MVGVSGGRTRFGGTHGGRLFMFTICCTKLKVAVIMACEAVSLLPVSTRTYGPTWRMNLLLREFQRRRQSLENVSERLKCDHTITRTRKGVRSSFQGWSHKRCCS